MSVSSVRSSVSNLVFHLYDRSVHPELFDAFAGTAVGRKAFQADVVICDAGHVVSFRHGDRTVTEVTTARQQPLPQRKRLLDKRLKGNREESLQLEGGLQYHVSYNLEQLEPEVFLHINEELVMDCGHADVAHRFPPGSRLSPGPLSLVRIDAGTRSLLIHAFHTFPENCAVVKTQSLYEL